MENHFEFDYNNVVGVPIDEKKHSGWCSEIVAYQNKIPGNIVYIFCTDESLLSINKKHLNHDAYTDIITFDYSVGDIISGDIFISWERVKNNSKLFETSSKEELLRVMAHGILHLCGFGDKTVSEKKLMRDEEDEMIKLFPSS